MKVLSAAEWRTDADGDVAFLWRDRVSRGTILDGDGERKCRASRKIGERSLSSEDGRIVGRLVQKNDATQKKEEKKGKRRRTSSPSFCSRVLPLLTSPYLSRGKMFLPMGAFQTVLRFGHATRQNPMGPKETEISAHRVWTWQSIYFKYIIAKFSASLRHVIACQRGMSQLKHLNIVFVSF